LHKYCKMLKEERFEYILQKLVNNKKVTLPELSEDLQVSEDTIRRDIEMLSQKGRLTKVRGGAIPHSPNQFANAYNDRIHILEHDKQIIAAKAVALLQPGQTILLDGGTTTFAMASLLPPGLAITVVTNNIPVAALLACHPTIEVILAGGKVFKSLQVTMGMETIRLLEQLRVDIYFTGICSLHTDFGISGPDYEEADIKKTMVASANKIVALTTLNKIGTAEPFHICDIDQLDTIITEADAANPLLLPFKNLSIEII